MSKQQDAVALLEADHKAVDKLFAQEEKAEHDAKKKQGIVKQIDTALTIHAMIEEEIFYPAIKKARAEHLKDEVLEGYEEHKQIKEMLKKIAALTPADETYDMKVKVLKEDVEHHVKDEEKEMFPHARKFLGEKRLMELGAEMAARKEELEENPPSDLASGEASTATAGK
jgi:hemerythrin superfamily protein